MAYDLRATLPERPCVKTNRVISVPMKGVVQATFINPVWLPVYTHWDAQSGRAGRNVPCVGDPDCPFHRPPRLQAPRYNGYAAVVAKGYAKDWEGVKILALPWGLCVDLAERAPRETGLRGVCVQLQRKGTKPNDPVDIVSFLESRGELPQPFDVEDALLRLWSIRAGHDTADREKAAAVLHNGLLHWRKGDKQ